MQVNDYFEIPAPNEPIELTRQTGTIRLRADGSTLDANVKATVRALPRPRVVLDVETGPYFGLDFSDEVEVTIASSALPIRCEVLKGKLFSQAPSTIRLRPLEEIAHGSIHVPISKVVFALPNFPEFLGHGVIEELPGRGLKRTDEIRLNVCGWLATIRNTSDITERKDILRGNGGFGITALGILERADGQVFVWRDAESHLDALRVFLSFACGRWTGPMLPVGFSSTGERVWERWSIPRLLDDGISVLTWFDTHHGETLSDIVLGFMEKWTDPIWSQAISFIRNLLVCAS